ncbi:hypothetical protein VTJ49DRAFT_2668 [Mycothermus thermophilus]|uniref:Uncharacterized protein n=1 Tax=Humicola insolens TaxID=85995 RepID=A0ABR3V9M2_HUMIN
MDNERRPGAVGRPGLRPPPGFEHLAPAPVAEPAEISGGGLTCGSTHALSLQPRCGLPHAPRRSRPLTRCASCETLSATR